MVLWGILAYGLTGRAIVWWVDRRMEPDYLTDLRWIAAIFWPVLVLCLLAGDYGDHRKRPLVETDPFLAAAQREVDVIAPDIP